VTEKPLAKYWLHNGMVKVGGEKMSKSLGNFTTIRDLLDRPIDPMAVRLFILQAHYRKPVDFTDEALEAATNGWETLKEGLLFGHKYGEQLGWKSNFQPVSHSLKERFQEAVDDDFNFAGGLAVLFEIAKELRKEGNLLVHQGTTEIPTDELEAQWNILVELAAVLGFEVQPEEKSEQTTGLTDEEIEALVQKRTEARKAKNWAESDRLRDELKERGITLIDQPGGVTKWHRN
jgi:cysteinyl-tRNA synthetase